MQARSPNSPTLAMTALVLRIWITVSLAWSPGSRGKPVRHHSVALADRSIYAASHSTPMGDVPMLRHMVDADEDVALTVAAALGMSLFVERRAHLPTVSP